MTNFSQDPGNQGITRSAPKQEQIIPQIDAEIGKKGHFWMETSWFRYATADNWNLTFFDKKNATL